jgi:ParB/RepB/Spo0J family partition protein
MTTEAFAHIPLAHIVTSLTNPRKHFDATKLAELAESIRASGVHQPVLVRPLPGDRLADTAHLEPRPQWELVSGERRVRASIMAEMDTIPALVRALSDSQVLDIQLVENLQREDLQPLEEAEGYEHLMTRHHPPLNADEVAAKIGKSSSYVYARLKLLNLCPEGQQAMRDGWLEPSTALLVARAPSSKMQIDILGNLRDYGDNVLSHRQASGMIQRQYMLRLGEAKFKITDATLIPEAGSCKLCPKRTGADPDIFADVSGVDVCTDPPCFKAKNEAHSERALKAARESGANIIEGREAKALIPHGYTGRVEGFLRLDDATDSPTAKPLRSIIGKLLEEEGIKPTLVADPHHPGELVAVVDHATASRLLARKGHQDQAEAIDQQAQQSAKDAAKAAQQKHTERFENAWRWAVLQAAWKEISAKPSYILQDAILRHLATRHLPNTDGCTRLCKLLELGTVAPKAALEDWIKAHPDPDRALALVMMFDDLAWQAWKPVNEQDNPQLLGIASEVVDVPALKAAVQAEHTAQIKAKNMHKSAAATGAKTPDTPLNPAAQAGGVRGGGKLKKTGTPAAPKRPRTTPEEALQGIAAAMQGEGSGGGDCAPLEPIPDGASAVGEEGRATAPDAGADQALAPGARVVALAGVHAGQAGTVIEDLAVCTDEVGQHWLVHLDGKDASTEFEARHLVLEAGYVAWPFPTTGAP